MKEFPPHISFSIPSNGYIGWIKSESVRTGDPCFLPHLINRAVLLCVARFVIGKDGGAVGAGGGIAQTSV